MSEPENALQALAAAVGKEHEEEREYPGLTHFRTEFVDHRRWEVVYLDVYLHVPSGTYAGVLFRRGATEYQDSESDPQIVAVERDPTPRFRLKGTPR